MFRELVGTNYLLVLTATIVLAIGRPFFFNS